MKITKNWLNFSAILLTQLSLFPHLATLANQPDLTNSTVNQSICPADLGEKIEDIVFDPDFQNSRWGVQIQTQGNQENIYSLDPDYFFIPASNQKLITTAVALQKINPETRILTSVYGTKTGDLLYVVGRGDPSFGKKQLVSLAQQLKAQGIKEIKQLVGVDSYFQGRLFHPNWQWEDVQSGYGAPVNSLIFNQNSYEIILSPQSVGQPLQATFAEPQPVTEWKVINKTITVSANESEFVDISRNFDAQVVIVKGQLRVGSKNESVYFSVSDPAENFLEEFQAVLQDEGILVKEMNVDRSPDTLLRFQGNQNLVTELARVESPTVAELVREVNLESNNLYAEVLLRLLGVNDRMFAPMSRRLPRLKDTADRGLETVKTSLLQMGIMPNNFVLSDGSGLSRLNLVTPQAIVQILQEMLQQPTANIYQSSLPIAGVSGTLKNRLNTTARGIVYAKTGTLTGVSALSGYVEPPNYQPLVFSIMVNDTDASVAEMREAIDLIVSLLTQLRNC